MLNTENMGSSPTPEITKVMLGTSFELSANDKCPDLIRSNTSAPSQNWEFKIRGELDWLYSDDKFFISCLLTRSKEGKDLVTFFFINSMDNSLTRIGCLDKFDNAKDLEQILQPYLRANDLPLDQLFELIKGRVLYRKTASHLSPSITIG